MIYSAAIDAALALAEADGNTVAGVHPSYGRICQVVYLLDLIDEDLRERLRLDQRLRHATQGPPNDIPMEFFIDDVARISIAFFLMRADPLGADRA